MIRRLVPSVLTLALAWSGPVHADNGPTSPPPLESRVGKTITVVEPNRPQERAVIMQVWRLPDGRPAMQAHSLTSGDPLTIVEDEKAPAAERFRVFRWKADGTVPDGCPKPPAQTVVQQNTKPQTVTPASATQLPQQVPVTMTARQQGSTSAYAASRSTSAYVLRPPNEQPATQTQVPVTMVGSTSAYVRPMVGQQPPPKPAEPAPLQPKVAQGGTTQQTPQVFRTADGRQTIVVTEPGQPPRQCVILGHNTQPDGTRGTRVQALDNGEVMFLVGCCLDGNCAPCAPAKPSFPKLFTPKPKPECPPVVVQKTEPAKPVVIQKVEPPKVEEKKPEPPKVEEKKPEPPKVVEKKPEPVQPPVCIAPPAAPEKPLQVPVPLVPLATNEPAPCVPPPQPPMSPYHTQMSPAWKAHEADVMPDMLTGYQGAGVPSVSYGPPLVNECPPGDRASLSGWGTGPFAPVTQMPVILGVDTVYADVQAEAVKRTVFLMTVLKTSSHPENRIWAADRLKVVNDVQIKPYVVDALVYAAKTDDAPLVRISAMASLTDMGAHTPAVVSLLEEGMQHRDPRVRDCCETCLKQFGYDPAAKKGDNVRPASGEKQ